LNITANSKEIRGLLRALKIFLFIKLYSICRLKELTIFFFNFNSILRTSDLVNISNPCVGAQNFPTYLPAKCFLKQLPFELAIKIYFEIDNNKEAPHTTILGEIFPKLSETTRKRYRKFFCTRVVVKAKLMENVIGKKNLYIPEFKEAIK